MNILCAALIRYPWKKRQTGFVITHAGLLIMLAGSYYSVRTADEGQVGMLEGDGKGELVRTDYPVIRVWEVDPHTQQYRREIDLPFLPGSFAWGPGKPQPRASSTGWARSLTLGLAGSTPVDRGGLEQARRSVPVRGQGAPAGIGPVDGARRGPRRLADGPHPVRFKPPGDAQEMDAFPSEDDQWFTTEKKFYRVARRRCAEPPRLITFSAVDRPELVEDFLKPPATTGKEGRRPVPLPGSIRPHPRLRLGAGRAARQVGRPAGERPHGHADRVLKLPPQDMRADHFLGEDPLPIAHVRGPARQRRADHPHGAGELADGSQRDPLARRVPRRPPSRRSRRSITWSPRPSTPRPMAASARSTSWPVPTIRSHYRVFGRGKDGQGELRAAGAVAKGKPIVAFGGGPNMPMTITLRGRRLPARRGSRRTSSCRSSSPRGRRTRGSAPAGSR